MAGFNFADFSDTTGLNLIDSAAITQDKRLRLTEAVGGQTGAAWFATEKQFVTDSFSTTFQFQLANFEGSAGASAGQGGSDGFVFAIQNVNPSYVSGGGGNLAYNGLANSLVVEFDTFQNAELGDTSHSSISVHSAGVGANTTNESKSLGHYDTSPIIDDGNVHTAKIDYYPGRLSIYLDNMTTPKLSVDINLADKLALADGRAWIGFTAATGGGWETHDILTWNFDVPSVPNTIVSIGDGAGIEGNSGTLDFVFTATRFGDASGTTTVNWSTESSSATTGNDFTAAFGSLTFNPLETTKTIVVSVSGDTIIEQHETFSVKLNGVIGGTISDPIGTGTILNDEATFSIADTTLTEGSHSTGFLGNLVSAGVGGLDNPYDMIYGPDGLLYVSTLVNSSVLRFDAATGAPRPAPGKAGAEFVSPGAGGLTWPRQLGFGPDGNLYVASQMSDSVLRFDAASGAPLGALVAPGVGGIRRPKGLTFASDGNLYVTNVKVSDAQPGLVLRFDAATGAPAGISGQAGDAKFIPFGTGGLDNPNQAVFHNGNLYVGNITTNSVLRYAADGSFIGEFVVPGSGGLTNPMNLQFHNGFLYVVSMGSNQVLRYTETTGAFVDTVVPETGGLARPISLLFRPDDSFVVSSLDSDEIRHYGAASQAAFTVSLSVPSGIPVTVNYSTSSSTATSGIDFTATSGTITITFAPGQTSRTILVRTLDDLTYEGNETFMVNLSNASGAVITDAQGTATIIDNELPPTKFYVVNDGSPDRTYEYTASGTAIENYAMQSTNTAPRGAASTAAGDKVWVVDANKKVYVYDTSGGLLGSWSAGSLASNATVEGITTNGTDVWIVDSRSDKVFKYAGAATRTEGSQNATSSFSLNRSNTSPTDLVTDGASIWVLNNTPSTDKVFKYSVDGSSLGNWTITFGGGSPTGLTIDPTSNVGNIWIVDNNTDRVYQFDSATSRTSGSASPSSSFALATGNSNPQGIADPPPPARMLASQSLSVASGSSTAEVEKPTAKILKSSDQFIAQVDSFFENWNEDSLFSQTRKRWAGRR